MASVFLSYDHEDTDRAHPIARALEKAGHSVWWDRRIAAGAEFNTEIEGAVEHADAVVVLWSEHSVRSAWVRDEAAEGRDLGKLVPATIDRTKPPMGFRQYQTIDLSRRKRSGGLQQFDELLAAIDNLAVGHRQPSPAPPALAPDRKWQATPIKWPLPAFLAAILIVGAGFLGWRLIHRSSVPVVAVAAAEDSPAARDLARNLLVKLGSLHSARTESVRLIGPETDEPVSADLIFETSGTDPQLTRADLVLLEGNDRSVLWSRDFRKESNHPAEIEQQIAYTAAQVLGCALEASEQRKARLDRDTLKLFLNGCALFGERYRTDPLSVVPIFSQVVAKAPHFQPAWARLLLAEAQNTRAQMIFLGRGAPEELARHVAAVRKLNPQLPELHIAEYALLPLDAFAQRSRLIDEAVRLNPNNPHLRVIRSEFLHFVGRMQESLDDARRAVELDPLSPGFRSNLIQNLTYSGHIPAAQEELRRAEQLWPANPAIEDARFRLNSRYGDAKDALRMLQSHRQVRQFYMSPDMEAYLHARIDPTEANVQRAIAATRNPELPEARRMVQLAQLLAEFGRDNELYGVVLRWGRTAQLGVGSAVFFRPPFRRFRRDPRFIQIMARAGLVDYWRSSRKWPDFCFEPDLPYDCKVETAKLPA